MFISKLCFPNYLMQPLIRKSFALEIARDKFDVFSKVISIPFEKNLLPKLLRQVIKKSKEESLLEIYHFLFLKSLGYSSLSLHDQKKNPLILNSSNIFEKDNSINQINNPEEKMQPTEDAKASSLPINNDGERKSKDLLIEKIQSISQWDDLPEDDRRVAVKKFMNAIGHLYLDYYQFHLEEAKACALQYSSLLESALHPVTSYIIKLEHSLRSAGEYDDPWEMACWGRTNIEAFNTMFGEVVSIILDPTGIDDYMDDRRGNASLKSSLIPKNVPPSHWWWFEEYR